MIFRVCALFCSPPLKKCDYHQQSQDHQLSQANFSVTCACLSFVLLYVVHYLMRLMPIRD